MWQGGLETCLLLAGGEEVRLAARWVAVWRADSRGSAEDVAFLEGVGLLERRGLNSAGAQEPQSSPSCQDGTASALLHPLLSLFQPHPVTFCGHSSCLRA